MLQSIFQAVLSVFASIWKWRQEKKEDTSRSLGQAEQSNADLKDKLDQIAKANRVQIEIEGEIARNPDKIEESDGFRRD